MGLLLSCLAFVVSALVGRRSLAAGLGVTLTIGYLYGIVRANVFDGFSHFIFDGATLGLYLAVYLQRPRLARSRHLRPLVGWVQVLIGWTVIMALIPLQHPLIQMVGLRGNSFLVPFVLLGAWLERADALRLALWLAGLNLLAGCFAGAEYFLGVEVFYPENAITWIIFISRDVADNTALRIPACFANAASYGGTMVATIPWLLGAWVQRGNRFWTQVFLGAGLLAALLGTFLCACRSPVILLLFFLGFFLLSSKVRFGTLVALLFLLAGVGFLVSTDERLQRFTTLADFNFVQERLQGSVNMSFFEILSIYPMGNGMGAGGTSIPFFLSYLIRNPIVMENELGRILVEQGLVGLLLWVGFAGWVLLHRPTNRADPWLAGRRFLWFASVLYFLTCVIGLGLLTSIPQSSLFLLGVGFAMAGRLISRPVHAPAQGRRVASCNPLTYSNTLSR